MPGPSAWERIRQSNYGGVAFNITLTPRFIRLFLLFVVGLNLRNAKQLIGSESRHLVAFHYGHLLVALVACGFLKLMQMLVV